MATTSATSKHIWRPNFGAESVSDTRPLDIAGASIGLKLPGVGHNVDRLSSLTTLSRAAEASAAVRRTIKTKWFWYAIASAFCWTGWAFTAKIGSREIPPAGMQFVSAFGFIVVCIGALARTRATEKINPAGRFYALVSGVLLALGGICLYASYRTGYDASVTTALTSLYPMVTVLCAFVFLREKLNGLQVIGLFFAAAAMFILSL